MNLVSPGILSLIQLGRDALIRLNTEIEKEGPDWWRGYEEKKKKAK